jgi:hypothetical protein
LDNFLPGFETIPYSPRGVSVELLKPCPRCKKLGTGDAWARDDKSIAVVCLRCYHKFSLPKRQYGSKVGLSAEEMAGTKRQRSTEARDARIHARTNYACVYCEGERDARRFRLAQLVDRHILSEVHADVLSSSLGSASWNDVIAALGTQPRNLFGLTVDHLIGFKEQADLGANLEPLERARCEDVWLVSAHVGCNRAKYAVGRPMADRLNVYLRYVWPFAGKDDGARWDDFRLYVGVLDKLLRLPLSERSDRRASSRG